jgi:hypothetical protein
MDFGSAMKKSLVAAGVNRSSPDGAALPCTRRPICGDGVNGRKQAAPWVDSSDVF